MEPATATLIVAGISAAVISIQQGIQQMPTKAEKRLKEDIELKRYKAAIGDVGLTDAQKEELATLGLGATQAAEREYLAREGELAALTGLTGGQMTAQQIARQEMVMEQRGKVGEQIRVFEVQERERQAAELAALEESLLNIQAMKKAEALKYAGEMGGMAATAATQSMLLKQMEGKPSQQAVWVDGKWVYPQPGLMGGTTAPGAGAAGLTTP